MNTIPKTNPIIFIDRFNVFALLICGVLSAMVACKKEPTMLKQFQQKEKVVVGTKAMVSLYKFREGVIYSVINDSVLKADLYIPKSTGLHPAVVLIHGGAFVFGNRKEQPVKNWAIAFANQNYFSASIDYRLAGPSIQGIEYAAQDAKCFIRFLKENWQLYKIDTNRIFIMGTSAGGITACEVAYRSNYNAATINNGYPNHSVKVKAISNCWGAVLALSEINHWEAPSINIFGTLDQTVPIDCGISFGIACCGGKQINLYSLNHGMESDVLSFAGYMHGLLPADSTYTNRLQMTFDSTYLFFNQQL